MQNAILNFSQKKSILAYFGWFSRLRGQFLEPKLHPIVLAMEQAIVRHILRNILGPGKEEIGAGMPELQGKTSDFQESQLWDQISSLWASSVSICRDHVVYPPNLRLGLEIFGIATRRKTVGPWGPKSVIGHISPEPQDSSKI